MQTDTSTDHQHDISDSDDGFPDLLVAMQTHIDRLPEGGRLFRVDVPDLWVRFLKALPEERRQHYNCRACMHFVERFGDLVHVAADGTRTPVVWPDNLPAGMLAVVSLHMRRALMRTAISGAFFVDNADRWGTPINGSRTDGTPWAHLAVTPLAHVVRACRPSVAGDTAHQAAARVGAERDILLRSLADYPRQVAARAQALLRDGAPYRSEVASQIVEWFFDLHCRLTDNKHDRLLADLAWLAAATAPAGWCHVRSSVLGTLLDDLKDGRPDFAARWSAKLHPLQYQRPQAAPSAGNVERAERLIAEMGLAPALRRRFALLEDVDALWTPSPTPATAPTGGVFGHLRTKDQKLSALLAEQPGLGPVTTLTFDKFRRTVLPIAVKLEFLVPTGAQPFAALVTAADPSAPPIVQWDHTAARNPITWYIHGDQLRSGSEAATWNLRAGAWVPVTAICLGPHMWDRPRADGTVDETTTASLRAQHKHHGDRTFVLLDGARDRTRPQAKGGGLFPSHLRGDLREVRATLEAHSKRAEIEGPEQATACGLMLQAGVPWSCTLRATDRAGVVSTYKLDRWD